MGNLGFKVERYKPWESSLPEKEKYSVFITSVFDEYTILASIAVVIPHPQKQGVPCNPFMTVRAYVELHLVVLLE